MNRGARYYFDLMGLPFPSNDGPEPPTGYPLSEKQITFWEDRGDAEWLIGLRLWCEWYVRPNGIVFREAAGGGKEIDESAPPYWEDWMTGWFADLWDGLQNPQTPYHLRVLQNCLRVPKP